MKRDYFAQVTGQRSPKFLNRLILILKKNESLHLDRNLLWEKANAVYDG